MILEITHSGVDINTVIVTILTTIGTVFGGQWLWKYLIAKSNHTFTLKKSRIEADEKAIQHLEAEVRTLKTQNELINLKLKQLNTTMKVLLPLLEELSKNNPALEAALNAAKEIVKETEND